MFKKLLTVLLVLVTIFSFAACGSNTDTDNKTDSQSSSSKETGVVGLWKANTKIKLNDVMNATPKTDDIPIDSVGFLSLFPEVESDVELEVCIEFKDDNSYEIKYELENFKAALREYYDEAFEILKQNRPLFEEIYNMDFVVIETMMINSKFHSYKEIVEAYKEKFFTRIEATDNAEALALVAPSLTGSEVKSGYVIVDSFNYELDGQSLKLCLKEDGEAVAEFSFKDDKIEFVSVPQTIEIYNGILNGGFVKVK